MSMLATVRRAYRIRIRRTVTNMKVMVGGVLIAVSTLFFAFVSCTTKHTNRATIEQGAEREQTAEASPPEWAPSHLEWEPRLSEATLGSRERPGRLKKSVELNACDAGQKCRALSDVKSGSSIKKSALSKSGDVAYVWMEEPAGGEIIRAYSVSAARLTGECVVDDGASRPLTSTSIIAVGGERVMVRWGAGSGVLEAVLCTKDGDVLHPQGGGPYALSEEKRYAASYPEDGTPLAANRTIVIEDLTTGAYVEATPSSIETGYVEHIRWNDESAVMTIVERDEAADDKSFTTDVEIPLP